MKVILQKDVLNLGDAGEVKEVPSGYARNFLIPRKLVVPVRGGSMRALDHQKKVSALRTEKRIKEMQDLSEKLKQLGSVEVVVRVGAKNRMFGAVTNQNIALALREAGFQIDKRKIELTDTLKAVGTYTVRVRLADKIVAPISVVVSPDQNDVAAQREIEEVTQRHEKKREEKTETAEERSQETVSGE
jgi:large subunit ribosomal protein L9